MNKKNMKRFSVSLLLTVAVLAALFVSIEARAQGQEKLVVPIGKSVAIKVMDLKKVMAVKEGVVEVLNVSDDEVILSGVGEKPTATQLIIWDARGKSVFDVETIDEMGLVQEKFKVLFGDPAVTLQVFPDGAYLKGTVAKPEKVKEAETVLAKLVTDRPVVNLLQVAQPGITLKQRISDAIKIPTVKVTILGTDEETPEGLQAQQANASGTVSPVKPRILLEGTVKDQNDYQHLNEVVKGFFNEDEISNLVVIDKPIQVVFQAYILQVNKKNSRDLGIEWGGAQSLSTGLTQGTLRYVENISNVFRGDTQTSGAPMDKWANPFKVSNINRFDIIAAQVKAWEDSSKVKVLANPKLTVYANATPLKMAKSGWSDEKKEVDDEQQVEKDSGLAFVTIGQEIRYISTTDNNGRPSYDKIDATLKLSIRDLFVNDQKLKFTVFAKQAEPNFTRGADAPPDVQKRSVMTTIQTGNQETVVLGGLINTSKSTTEGRIPLLCNIPYLGRLFRFRNTSSSENELVILLTPEIIGIDKDGAMGKKFETIPIPRRSERLEQLHTIFQGIKDNHFPQPQTPTSK